MVRRWWRRVITGGVLGRRRSGRWWCSRWRARASSTHSWPTGVTLIAAPTATTPARRAPRRWRGRTAPSYSSGSAEASTRSGPTLSRVRNVLASPVRRRSRNSASVACSPTPTIREASWVDASSSAASSVVAVVSNRSGRMLSRSRCSIALRGDPRSTSTTTSRALRSTAALGWSSLPPVSTTTSGRWPASTMRVGAAVDTDEHRTLLADERPDAAQLVLPAVRPGDHDDRATRHVGGRLRDAVAVQQEVLLAPQELGRVVREALELGGEPAARLAHLAADDVGGDLACRHDQGVARVHDAGVDAQRACRP